MVMNDKSHRLPALVLAAGFTTAVVIGLSALAQSRVTMAAPDTRQVVATTPSVPQIVAVEALVAPLRIDVVATRLHTGLQTVAEGVRSKQPG
jgi:histidine ammonia-lyase